MTTPRNNARVVPKSTPHVMQRGLERRMDFLAAVAVVVEPAAGVAAGAVGATEVDILFLRYYGFRALTGGRLTVKRSFSAPHADLDRTSDDYDTKNTILCIFPK